MTQTSHSSRPTRAPLGLIVVAALLLGAVVGWTSVSTLIVATWTVVRDWTLQCVIFPYYLATQEPGMLMAIIVGAIIVGVIASKIVRKRDGR